jgi:hypothetical protein
MRLYTLNLQRAGATTLFAVWVRDSHGNVSRLEMVIQYLEGSGELKASRYVPTYPDWTDSNLALDVVVTLLPVLKDLSHPFHRVIEAVTLIGSADLVLSLTKIYQGPPAETSKIEFFEMFVQELERRNKPSEFYRTLVSIL